MAKKKKQSEAQTREEWLQDHITACYRTMEDLRRQLEAEQNRSLHCQYCGRVTKPSHPADDR